MIINNLIKVTNKLMVVFMQWWNVQKLKSFGKQIQFGGGKYRLIGSFYIRLRKNGKITIGKDFTISSGFCYNPITRNVKTALFVEDNAVLEIGDGVGLSGTCVWSHQKISIGNRVKIGGDTIIIDSDCHSLDSKIRSSTEDQKYKKTSPVVIEDDVLIGARCVILKGVTIGARSVIGAGSVVVRDIPEDCIAVGNPCKVIKK